MKKIIVLLILLSFGSNFISAQNQKINSIWKVSDPVQLYLPAFSNQGDINKKKFTAADFPKNLQLTTTPDIKKWKETNLGQDSLINSVDTTNELIRLSAYINTDRWTKAQLILNTNGIGSVTVDGKKIDSKTDTASDLWTNQLTLSTGKHWIIINLISTSPKLYFKGQIRSDQEQEKLYWTLNPQRTVNIHDLLDGEEIYSSSISPSGKYVLIKSQTTLKDSGKTEKSFKIIDLATKQIIYSSIQQKIGQLKWLPKTDRLSYIVENNLGTNIYIHSLTGIADQKIANHLQKFGSMIWSPNEDYIIYSYHKIAQAPGDLKHIFGNDDRLPYFRNRDYLYCYDLKTEIVKPLTKGYLSADIQDISPDGQKLLFSTTRMQYSETPFTKQNLYELNLKTFKVDTVWKDKLYPAYCQYSPDGNQLLAIGAPLAFGKQGEDIDKDQLSNDFDMQLYLYNLKDGSVNYLSHDFNPCINNAYWLKNGQLYVNVQDKDYVNLYKYNWKTKKFNPIKLSVDVLDRIDFAKDKAVAVYYGTSITSPQRLYQLDLKHVTSDLISYPKEKDFEQISTGKTEDWNFINKKGTTIYGRVYYPVNYQADKKYPVIVYYYGGTSPTDRHFGGRYPKNTWTAHGYMVYVLQPSGATGFGQKFSALHVNGWGKDAIDDIIDGTKKFLAAHPDADAKNVGCMGASYGGYTTMLLQTRTKIFKTAIAHAGISSLTSYWGQGYWGYSYNASAGKYSYPWNRKDIYVGESPLYNADKFNNSILLLHGTADTNVPTGESLQYYAALKILGKDVQMVLIKGENHHILDYTKRLEWHETILAWFDMRLKNQPEHWNELYPDKQL